MAIRKEEEKKNGMKVTDNMDGEKKANDKLAKYEPGVFDLTKYNKYKKALREDRVKDIFPNEPQKILMEMYNRFMKETAEKLTINKCQLLILYHRL